MNLKESETYKNLQTALEKESLDYTQYTFFYDIAKKSKILRIIFRNTRDFVNRCKYIFYMIIERRIFSFSLHI